jgi:signal transduction histidine kinase
VTALPVLLLLSTVLASGGDQPIRQMEILEDPSRALDIDQVSQREFRELTGKWPGAAHYGYTKSAIWLRVTISNPADHPVRWFLAPFRRLDHVALYEPRGNGWSRRETGRLTSVFEREIFAPQLLFPIWLESGDTTLYLRIETINSIRLDLHLYGERSLAQQVTQEWIFFGLFYGALVALLVYNLFIFSSVGDSSYLYYTIFQVGMLLAQAANDDLAHSLFWPHSPLWRIWSESFAFGLFALGALGFTRTFLGLATLSRRLDRVVLVAQIALWLLGMACPLSTTVAYQKTGLVCIAIFSLGVELIGLYAWRRGRPQAGLFLLGWTGLCMMSAVGVLVPLGVSSWLWVYREGGKLGALTEALVLSLGLASRVQRMRREKDHIQAELIAARTAQAESLEKKVAERTTELNEALTTLKSTQARMLKQSRLASLGHLVAGVAHEVGNPLNFTRGGALEVERRLGELEQLIDGERGRAILGDARRAAGLITNGNERIRRIVEHLRGFVSGRPSRVEPTDLLAGLEQTLAIMDPQLMKSRIQIIRDLQPLPAIDSTPGELAQVFMNLLLNSCQAMPEGGEVHISSRASDRHVELSFADTGPGIPVEHREAIFDPFFTTRASSDGSGLGLSIAWEIVRRHGGELELRDSAVGALFVIRLPSGEHDDGSAGG